MAEGMGFIDRVFEDQAGKRALMEGQIMKLEAKVAKLVEEMTRVTEAIEHLGYDLGCIYEWSSAPRGPKSTHK